MKQLVIASLLVLCLAAVAQAGVINDIRTGVIPEGSVVQVNGAVVTAVQNSSFTMTELPAGPYTAIWVYVGAAPAVAIGDVVEVKGLTRNFYGRDEINLLYPGDAHAAITGTSPVPNLQLTTTQLQANPEAWESHVVTITDGLIVQEMLPEGMWRADSVETGLSVIFDDYFYDYATVDLGDCYNNAYGMYQWFGGMWIFKVFTTADTDCTVANEDLSFGSLKALYR
ncbi:MAG: hypothetical protein Q7W29_05860 [bacterium]|nr:hypothetical protein [bacterium]